MNTTATAVSRVLKNSKVLMSKESKGIVSHYESAGFKVRQKFDNMIEVWWVMGSWKTYSTKEEESQKVSEVLTSKGFVFEQGQDGRFVVTGKKVA